MKFDEIDDKGMVRKYLAFKKECLDLGIFDIDEIIKLFDVLLHHLKQG